MSDRIRSFLALTLAVVLLIAVNLLAARGLQSARIDLTEQGLYTLSDGTLRTLAALDEPVTLRLFLSRGELRDVPALATYADRVQELLAEYSRVADGQLQVEIVEPEPFSEDEDRAVGYGLQGLPAADGESRVYFGLVGSGPRAEHEVIPFFLLDREPLLEYDITRMIDSLGRETRSTVGILTGLMMDGPPRPAPGMRAEPWAVVEQMREQFEVRFLEDGLSRIPPDVDVLFIAGPANFVDTTLYAIDQFILGGGRAVVFVDPYAESATTPIVDESPEPVWEGDEGFGRLLARWGLELVPGRVVADMARTERVQFMQDGRAVVLDYPVWMRIPGDALNRDDIVTSNLGTLVLASVGALLPLDDADDRVQITPLIESTDQAMRVETSRLDRPDRIETMLREFQSEGRRFMLAARVSGRVDTAFADGPPQPRDEQGGVHLDTAQDDVHVIVVADSDMLTDRFWVRTQSFMGTQLAVPMASNGAFALNAVEHLAGGGDLISVRSRGRFTRPFTRVRQLQAEAEVQFRRKEQELAQELEDAESNLSALQAAQPESEMLFQTAQQQAELERFRAEALRIRSELRAVRGDLRRDIERLQTQVSFANIGLVPLLLALAGMASGLYRLRRRRIGLATSRAAADRGS